MTHKRTVVHTMRRLIGLLHPNTVFTPAEVIALHFGSPDAVRQTLSRLVKTGEIRRIRKGYYMLGRTHRGPQEASQDAIAVASARKRAITYK